MNKSIIVKLIAMIGGICIFSGLLIGLYLNVWFVFIIGWILFIGSMFYDLCFVDDCIGL